MASSIPGVEATSSLSHNLDIEKRGVLGLATRSVHLAHPAIAYKLSPTTTMEYIRFQSKEKSYTIRFSLSDIMVDDHTLGFAL
jgi:hypothetical protein